MAARTWRSWRKLAPANRIMDLPTLVTMRTFMCTPVRDKLIATFRTKPKKEQRPKMKELPWKKAVVKPRDDVYFLYDQDPPSHTFKDALDALRAYAFFEETVRLNLRLNMNEKKIRTDAIRGSMLLPKPFKAKRILVFAEDEVAVHAKEAGADFVGGKELIVQVESGELEFDYCLSSLDFLPNLSHMPRILKDKMPNTRRGTATNDVSSAVAQYRRGHSYKTTRQGHVNSDIALLSFSDNEIRENMRAFISTIESHMPQSLKQDQFFKKLVISSQYGPGLLLNKEEIFL
ncbi:large ribosomal subunit protein uL1-like [Rhopilema esculentum]|uniref:large ribosomal subunit protein uL1-like n=1 Tax=Rhopilema esculentum TaxID=499914 RepID=UPI0031E3B5F5